MTKNTIELTAENLTEVTGGSYDVFQNETAPDTVLYDGKPTLTNDQGNPAVKCIGEDPALLKDMWSVVKALWQAFYESGVDGC